MKIQHVLFLILFSVCLSVYAIFFLFSHKQQYAAGNTVFASPGDDLGSKVQGLQPGDTLILHDGIYTGQLSADNIHGTASAPITIKAENDGKAIIDGQNNVTIVLSLMNSSYLVVQGFAVKNATGSVVKTDGSTYVTLQRITASNAGSGNTECFSASNGASYITIEDSAGWGRCRYVFLAYHSNHITFRRDFAKWEQTDNFSPAPRSGFGAYGSTDILFENDIGYNIYPTSDVSDWFTGVWETTDGPQTQNISYFGCIFYNVLGDGIRVNDLQAFPNTVIKDSFFNNPVIPNISYPFTKGIGVDWVTPVTGTISNNVFVGNNIAISQGNGVPAVSNNVFINNTTAISGQVQSSNNYFWQNTSNGVTLSGTDKQADPSYDTNTFGTGAYFFVPQSSPLKSANAGANLIYEYENGTLTSKSLWPWPMEDRIKAEKGISVTYQSGGGFWKTLNGVYPNQTISTTPSTSVTSASGTAVAISVCPHGIGNCGDNTNPSYPGNTTPKHAQRPVTVKLFDSTNTLVGTFQGTITYNGSTQTYQGTVTLGALPSGNYLVSIETPGYLSAAASGIISITSGIVTTIPSVSLVAGDVNGDNQIDILDYNDIISCYGSKQTTSGCLTGPNATTQGSDLNDDGVVNGTDYNLFLRELSVQKGK